MKRLCTMMLVGTIVLGLGTVTSANFTEKTVGNSKTSVTRELKMSEKAGDFRKSADKKTAIESRSELKKENFEARVSEKTEFLENLADKEAILENNVKFSKKDIKASENTEHSRKMGSKKTQQA